MNTLFLFRDNKSSRYFGELICLERICKHKLNSKNIKLNKLTVNYLLNNKIEIIISKGLPMEWYFITKGLKIVTITLGDLKTYFEYSDIVIDFMSKDSNRYFTGEDYSICSHKEKDEEFIDIITLIKKLKWDSDFFGFPIAYLSSRHLTENIIFHINDFVKTENIKLIEYLCNCHDNRSVKIAEQNGFHFTDIRLSFEKYIKEKKNVTLNKDFIFSLTKKNNINCLRKISEDLYKDSRYFFDKNFSVEQVNEFYKNWIEKAVLGSFDDECYCLFAKNNPIEFCTIKYISSNVARIGLFGFSNQYQGKCLAVKLLYLVLNKLIDKNVHVVTVVTQCRNYIAQRLYQSTGFLTKATELWYHKWL